MDKIAGAAASKGYAVGRLLFYRSTTAAVIFTPGQGVQAELQRLQSATESAKQALGELRRRALETAGENEAQVFEIHAMMLEDLDYQDAVRRAITDEGCTAQYAVDKAGKQFAAMFADLDDAYMKERAADVRDISARLVRILTGAVENPLDGITGQVIVAADDLMPSETIQMDKTKVLAFVTRKGSKISHTAILARTLGLPAVVGLGDQFDALSAGSTAAVDGFTGEVFVDPDEKTVADYHNKGEVYLEKRRLLQSLRGRKAVSMDGVHVEINANIGHTADVKAVLENDAEGVGLFRSEFLYMESDRFPSEESQFAAYRQVLQQMEGKRVVVRTLDLGADKQAPYFHLPREENPAMGYRAIRICLREPAVFHTQLRALLRASVYGRLAIMFPMVTSLEEVRAIKGHVAQVQTQLDAQGAAYDKNIEYGIMIETPAAALCCDILAPEVDFFSIGTNDLTQYTLACDRMNDRLGTLWDPRHLSVLRLIAFTVKHAHQAGIWVGICGESAADPDLCGIYLKLGVDELSVTPTAVLDIRNKVLHTDTREIDTAFLELG